MRTKRTTLLATAAITAAGLVTQTASASPCRCDRDGDMVSDVNDLLDFLSAYFLGDYTADFNWDSDVDVNDLLGFLSCYFEGCPNQMEVPAGVGLFSTFGNGAVPIPPDFFHPGSLPFEAPIQFVGQPLQTRGPLELGTTDLVIEFQTNLLIEDPTQPTEVAVEIVELNLIGAQPIMVQGQPWYVQMGLDSSEHPTGSLDVTPEGGSVSGTIPVKPFLVFANDFGDTRQLELPELEMNAFGAWDGGGPWVHEFQDQHAELNVWPIAGMDLSDGNFNFSLNPATKDFSRPPANVAPGANVDPAAGSLGRFANIMPGATVLADAIVGPNALVGPNSFVGQGSVIGANVLLGDSVVVGNGVHIYDNTIIAPNTVIEDGTVIGGNVQIGPNSFVGFESYIANGAQLGGGVQLMPHAYVNEDAVLEDGVFVDFELYLASGAFVPAGTFLDESMLECGFPGAPSSVLPRSLCDDLGGATLGVLIPQRGSVSTAGRQTATPREGEAEIPDGIDVEELKRKMTARARPSRGGTGREYEDDGYDCEDFARDLERDLQRCYDNVPNTYATFTIIWTISKSNHWFWGRVYTRTAGHCVVDIHRNGSIFWVEPQFGGEYAGGAGIGIEMDFDGDGTVEYETSPGKRPTESGGGVCRRIEVYDSYAAADKAYWPWSPWGG